jgi:hypothetical protein
MIKLRKMEKERNKPLTFWYTNLKEGDHLEYIGAKEIIRIILKWMLE